MQAVNSVSGRVHHEAQLLQSFLQIGSDAAQLGHKAAMLGASGARASICKQIRSVQRPPNTNGRQEISSILQPSSIRR